MFVMIAQVKNQKGSQKLTRKLDQTITSVNKKYAQDLVEEFKRTDQLTFEGVLEKAIYLFEVIDKFKYLLSEYDINFGVGFCEADENLSVSIEQGKVNAFHAIEKLEEKSDYGNAHIEVSLVRQNSLENFVNAALRTTDFIESRWRQSQYDLVKYLVLNFGFMETFVQKDVAEILELSPQNFNQQLKNSGYFNILRLKREMTVVLEQYRRAMYQEN